MNFDQRWIQSEVGACLEKIREERPIVHNITNLVVMNLTANALLAIGASPIMAHAEEELEEMVGLSRALVLNPGTLDAGWVRCMKTALALAKAGKRPVVLDPVGSGASRFRTRTMLELLESGGISVLRGNASEISSLRDPGERQSGGVDSRDSVDSGIAAAEALARRYGCAVVISGEVDFVTDGRLAGEQRAVRIFNGDKGMPRVTGLGCAATALIGAALCVAADPWVAAVAGMLFSGIAGELAGGKSEGPGSLAVAYLDSLASLDRGRLDSQIRIEKAKR